MSKHFPPLEQASSKIPAPVIPPPMMMRSKISFLLFSVNIDLFSKLIIILKYHSE